MMKNTRLPRGRENTVDNWFCPKFQAKPARLRCAPPPIPGQIKSNTRFRRHFRASAENFRKKMILTPLKQTLIPPCLAPSPPIPPTFAPRHIPFRFTSPRMNYTMGRFVSYPSWTEVFIGCGPKSTSADVWRLIGKERTGSKSPANRNLTPQ